MNSKLYHYRYKKFVDEGCSYKIKNLKNDSKFKKQTTALLEFCSVVKAISGRELCDFQLDIIRYFLPYVVQQYYFEFWTLHKNTICSLYGFTHEDIFARRLISATARREGKTTIYIHICVAILLTFPVYYGCKLRISLPAHKQDTSRETLNKIKQDLLNHELFNPAYVTINHVDVFRYEPNGKGNGFIELKAFATGNVSF